MKIFKNQIFTFVIGLIAMLTIVRVYAINSNEVTYNETTVDSALDYLYTKADAINNTNCVSGSFKCTTCTSTTTGQDLGLNFEPSLIYIHSNDFSMFIGYNTNVNSTKAYYHSTKTSLGSNNISSLFILDNGISIYNLSSNWNNIDYQFVACK